MTTTVPRPRVIPVTNGTAEQLARVAHFRALEDTQPEELDFVALFLLGDVGDSADKWELWEQLRDDCGRLWHLITDDWDEADLDDPREADAGLTAAQEEQARYERTRDRLCGEIERAIHVARYRAAEARRGTVGDAAVLALLGGAR